VLRSGLSAYEPGSADVTHLSDFIAQAAAEMAHLNGEGVCVLNGESHDHEHDEHDHE
jgi:translation initiation factor 2 beta subunit (eIF-2beta)/eIF-5